MDKPRPGDTFDTSPLIAQIDYGDLHMRVSTDRYHAPEYNEREREQLWMKVWQVAGRADELPEIGDWMEHRIHDQSFVLVRGRDGVIRGFVNACRHRGNAFCEGKGHAARFTCPYHNWSYGLGEAGPVIEAFHLEEMVPVGMNVRETINCNWKVVMDAFYESYHVQAVHPELIPIMDLSKERYRRFGRHGATTVPFQGTDEQEKDPRKQVEAFRQIPRPNFPGLAEVFPRFDELVAAYSAPDGSLAFPDAVIIACPHPDGDPNRCYWRVAHYIWLPPEEREAQRTEMTEVPEGEHVPYFLALEQDFSQMEEQQRGLRNNALEYMVLTRQEPKVAQFHTVLDEWFTDRDPTLAIAAE
jgi:phenylpropionate dioxygenase-like ring-hydroxylating dioxygenase large terminal subunit